jgi:hypothetical protein
MKMKRLPTVRAALLAVPEKNEDPWLVEGLWMREAVGIIGGEPKCGKSFLALDLAVAVAAGIPCLRRFPVRHSGPSRNASCAMPRMRASHVGDALANLVAAGRVIRSADGYSISSS